MLGPPETAETVSRSWTIKNTGRKVYQIDGKLWRDEWIEPATQSERVRRDEVPATAFFIVDAEGRTESREKLEEGEGGRWLWFRPEVICELIKYRGGGLEWYTRNTGRVLCSPGDGVCFGINELGLVNVYAKDVAFLPDWQQRLWAGFNVAPDGGLSEELHASQVRAVPANTRAPEALLARELDRLANVARTKLGITLFLPHRITSNIIKQAHRFRATNRGGLYALAKDLARLTAESIDSKALQTLVPPPKDVKWGSLKSLEKLLATKTEAAATLMSPLFGVYELRHADTHFLPEHEVAQALDKLDVDQSKPFVIQGFELMRACVNTIYRVREVLDRN